MSRLALKGCRGPSRAPREPKIHHKVRGWSGETRSHLPKPSGDQLRLLLLRLSQALDPRPHPEGCRAMSPLARCWSHRPILQPRVFLTCLFSQPQSTHIGQRETGTSGRGCTPVHPQAPHSCLPPKKSQSSPQTQGDPLSCPQPISMRSVSMN